MTTVHDIGDALVRARRAQGLSQKMLGALLGVRQQQVARWEADSYSSTSLERVSEVAEQLGVRIGSPLLAEDGAGVYTCEPATETRGAPVRDLGEIAARLREADAQLREYQFDRIGVFGSFASGTQTRNSDVDLLVETADPGGFRFIAAANFIEERLRREVDIVRPHLLRPPLRDAVLREVIYVWSAR